MNECEKTISKLNSEHNIKFVILLFIYYYLKIIRRGSRPPQNAEFGRFRLLFCRGRQKNVQRFITHLHSYCIAD